MDDDLEDFLSDITPKPRPEPPPVESTDDPLEDFLPPPKPEVPTTLTPELQAQRVLAEAPSANPAYVHTLVSRSSDAFIDALLDPTLSKRAKRIRNLILQQGGWFAYSQLKETYACHRRAKRDLVEKGITLSETKVRGDTIFELDPHAFQRQREGRLPLTPTELDELRARYNSKCVLCHTPHHQRHLEADHRVPFEVAGNSLHELHGIDAFQPLCGACNTKKQRACIECSNRLPDVCQDCFWANPQTYAHVATIPERRLEVVVHNTTLIKFLDSLLPKLQVEGQTPGEALLHLLLKGAG